MTMTLAVNNDLLTVNASTPGLIGSGTDFSWNNKGIMFNETTHRMSRSKVRADGIWIFWRAAMADAFSASLDDFFRYISLGNTGTSLNGYMVVDAKNSETGLIDAKVGSATMARSFMGLSGILDLSAPSTGFWMLYGTLHVNGSPFIWSLSSRKWQKLRDVPDRVDGAYTLTPLYLR
ncbi:MAG: hypothetical protein V1766_02940 [Pseudomonadota bacterium]